MSERKSCMFQKVSLGLVLSLMIFFSVPCALLAEENSVIDEISLGDLLNLEISVATKTKTTLQEAPSSVSVITGEEIRNMGARNIEDILKTVPGFDVIDSSITPVKNIGVRGISGMLNGTIKFLVNGHSLQGLFGGPLFNVNFIPVDNIKRIEIIRGPGSALYGTNAFIGVINFITKEGGDEPSEISLSGGSFNTIKPTAEFSYKKDDFKVYLYADHYSTDGNEPVIESDMATGAFGAANSGAPGKMTYDVECYTFQSELSYKNFYFTGFLQKLDRNNPVGVAEALTDESEVKELLAFGEIGYKHPISDKGNLTLKTYYDYGETDYNWEIFSEETAAFFSSVYSDAEPYPSDEGIYGNPFFDNSVFGGEITLDYKIHPAVQVVAGAMYDYVRQFNVENFASGNVTGRPLTIDGVTYAPLQYIGGVRDITDTVNWNRNEERKVSALYIQGTFDFKNLFSLERAVESLTLTSGLRYDNYSDVGDSLNPRIGLVYAPYEKLYFKALYGRAFRAPNFQEMYNINNLSSLGNPELEPEELTTIEGIIGYNFTKGIRGTLTYFDTAAENLIQLAVEGDVQRHVNLGEIRSRGMELELRAMRDKNKYAYLNLTYQDVKNVTNETIPGTDEKQEDFDIGSVPEIIGNIGVNYDISEYVIANVSANYVGKRERSGAKKWDGGKLVQADTRNAVESYVLLNTSLTFRGFAKGFEIRLSGYNLLNEDYRDPNVSGLIKNDIPREGRTFMGKVSYSF